MVIFDRIRKYIFYSIVIHRVVCVYVIEQEETERNE